MIVKVDRFCRKEIRPLANLECNCAKIARCIVSSNANSSRISATTLIAVPIDLFHCQPETHADAVTEVRLRLTVKRNAAQKVATQRELPGECLQNAGSPDGSRRFRYFTGRSLTDIAVKRKTSPARSFNVFALGKERNCQELAFLSLMIYRSVPGSYRGIAAIKVPDVTTNADKFFNDSGPPHLSTLHDRNPHL